MIVGRSLRGLRVALLLAVAVLASCAWIRPRLLAPPPTPGVEAARAIVERRDEESQTLTALFRIAVRTGGGAGESARGALAVARPDRLRLQIFSRGFLTVFDYTVNGDRYRLRQQGAPGIRYGTVGDDRSLLPVQWLARLFLGDGAGPIEVREVEAGFVLVRRERDGTRELLVPRDAAVIREETIREDGRVMLHARYDDFSKVDGVWLPGSIVAEAPTAGVTLSIDVQEYELNQRIDEDIFTIRP